MDVKYGHSFSKVRAQDICVKTLMALVREYPILYDVNHDRFRHNVERHAAWNEVAIRLNSTTLECRWRWKSLRDQWRRQKAFNESMKVSPYRKNFEYFEEMCAFETEKISTQEQEDLNLHNPSGSNMISRRSADQEALIGYSQFVARNVELASAVQVEEVQEIQPKVEEVDLTMEDIEQVSSSCADQAAQNTPVEVHVQNLDRPRKDQSSVINSTSNDFEDECLIAGRRIGYQLKSVDDFQRTIAEKLISDIVYNAKMGNLNANSVISLDVPQPEEDRTPNSRRHVPMQF